MAPRTLIPPAVLGLLLLTAACVPVVTLNPAHTGLDPVFDPGLLGGWTHDDGVTLIFSRSEDDSYDVSLQFKDDTYRLQGHLFRVGDTNLLDLTGVEPDEETAERRLLTHLMPFHSVHRVRREEDALTLEALDGDWLKQKIDAGELHLEHSMVQEMLVLTGSTEELQALLRRVAGEEEAFSDADELRRLL